MKLDPRIEKDTLIYTPFSLDGTNEMIAVHDKGYFSDDIRDFSDLKSCVHGELVELAPLSDIPYACKVKSSDMIFYSFYIPECNLKPVEKQYRPFTNTKEFLLMRNFNVGDLIHIRSKSDNTEHHLMLIGWTDDKVILGDLYRSTFKALLDKFELWDPDTGCWAPFGVEE